MKMNKEICPKCGCSYTERPALSREDGKTFICPKCGTKEALDFVQLSDKQKEEILATIYGKE